MSIKNVFKSTLPHNTFLFKNGKAAVFINGRYETDDYEEIYQLNAEIQAKIPYIYVDPNDASIDSSFQDEVREEMLGAMERVKARRAAAEAGTIVDPKSDKPFDSGSSAGKVDDLVNTGNTPISTENKTEDKSTGSNPSNSVAQILASRSAQNTASTLGNANTSTSGTGS